MPNSETLRFNRKDRNDGRCPRCQLNNIPLSQNCRLYHLLLFLSIRSAMEAVFAGRGLTPINTRRFSSLGTGSHGTIRPLQSVGFPISRFGGLKYTDGISDIFVVVLRSNGSNFVFCVKVELLGAHLSVFLFTNKTNICSRTVFLKLSAIANRVACSYIVSLYSAKNPQGGQSGNWMMFLT
jgi:hypothetical protein